jgi:LysR family glycine cleavage system transcriptional activator
LFERLAQGTALTPSGAALFAQVHDHFTGLDQALAHYRPLGDKVNIVVSTTQAFAALWLIPRLGGFYALYPGITIKVEADNDVVDLLREGGIDIAIRNTCKRYPGLYQRPLMEERFSVFMAAADPVDELIDVAWDAPQAPIVQWREWCEKAGLLSWLEDFNVRHYEDEHYALQAAVAGQGYILASEVLAQDNLQRGLLRQYRADVVLEGSTYVALCRPGSERLPAMRGFLDWLADQAALTR